MNTQAQATGTAAADNTPDLVDAAVRETEARMMASPELLQMRMDNESIITECRLRPRNMEAMKRELSEQLEAFPELADKAIYNKPIADGKYATDLSIKAAETLAEVYGYNRVQVIVSPVDADSVAVEASFIDYQHGRVWRDKGILSKFRTVAKAKGGGQKRIAEDRFNSVDVKAEASRRAREAILRCINAGLKAWFFNECKKVQQKTLTPEKVQEIVGVFLTKGVGLEDLEKLVGKPRAMGWTGEDRAALMNTWNAIKDGETTISQIIAERQPQQEDGLADVRPKAEDKLAKPKTRKKVAKNPEPEAEKPKPQIMTSLVDTVSKRLAEATTETAIDEIEEGYITDMAGNPDENVEATLEAITGICHERKAEIRGRGGASNG